MTKPSRSRGHSSSQELTHSSVNKETPTKGKKRQTHRIALELTLPDLDDEPTGEGKKRRARRKSIELFDENAQADGFEQRRELLDLSQEWLTKTLTSQLLPDAEAWNHLEEELLQSFEEAKSAEKTEPSNGTQRLRYAFDEDSDEDIGPPPYKQNSPIRLGSSFQHKRYVKRMTESMSSANSSWNASVQPKRRSKRISIEKELTKIDERLEKYNPRRKSGTTDDGEGDGPETDS